MSFDLGYALLWPPLFATFVTLAVWFPARDPRFPSAWFAGGGGVTLAYSLDPHWLLAGVGVGHMVFGALLWWRDRRKRKRAPRAYGAKSRALLAALVRKAREAAQPRRVLRPVPGGAS